eukprot:SAG11_NODE_11060_length_786_cov_1.071325_2_plen_105_part_00
MGRSVGLRELGIVSGGAQHQLLQALEDSAVAVDMEDVRGATARDEARAALSHARQAKAALYYSAAQRCAVNFCAVIGHWCSGRPIDECGWLQRKRPGVSPVPES